MPRTLAWGVLLGMAAVAAAAPEASAQSWRTVTMSRQVAGEAAMDVEIRYGAGRFTVRPADRDLLYRMRLRYDEDVFEPLAEYSGDRLTLGVRSLDRKIDIGKGDSEASLDLALARNVPMNLDLEFGAVRADIDLGGLSLRGLELATGASETTIEISEPNKVPMARAELKVGAASFKMRGLGNLDAEVIEIDAGVGDIQLDFTGDWRRDAEVVVDMGLGALRLGFPRGLGVKLVKDTFLTSLDASRMTKRGDAYYSGDWETASRRVTVSVDAAFGSIDVIWLP